MSTTSVEGGVDKPFTGVVVVFTGVQRKSVEKYYREIKRLGGTVSDSIDDSTSFLVVRRVGSEKYIKARKQGVPCVQVRWLNDCLHQKALLATDAYLARPFEGCVITATQLELEDRETLEKVVTEHGGTYLGDLRINAASGNGPATTHLVALARWGEKYLRASIEKDIRIVNPDWIDACVAEGGWVNERHYPVVTKPASAAAAAAAAAAGNSKLGKASTAQFALRSVGNASSNGGDAAFKSSAVTATAAPPGLRIDDLPPIGDFTPSHVFEGHIFYIHGYLPQIHDFVIQLIIKGGGMRYPLLLPGVTVAVFEEGSSNDSFIRTIKRMPFDVISLSAKQLVDWYKSEHTEADSAAAVHMQDSIASSENALSGVDQSPAVIEGSADMELSAESARPHPTDVEEEEQEEQASLGIGTELQLFTALLKSAPAKPPQPVPAKQRSRPWGVSQGARLSGDNTTKRRSGLSRKQIEGGSLGQTPTKKTRLHQQLEPEPESQQITFLVDP